MTVHVLFTDPELDRAHVRIEPGLLARWLLRRSASEDVVVAVTAIGGGRLWISDATGRRLRDRHIVEAIEEQRARLNSQPLTRALRAGLRLLDRLQ